MLLLARHTRWYSPEGRAGAGAGEPRYGAGKGTSLEVLQASEQLLRIESQYVEALFNYNLAVLTFETAKVAPVSGLSTGSSASTGTSSR